MFFQTVIVQLWLTLHPIVRPLSLPRIAPKVICFRIVHCYDNYLPLSCSHGHKGSLMIPKGWLGIRPAQRYPAQNIYLRSLKTTRLARLEQDVLTNITRYWAIMIAHLLRSGCSHSVRYAQQIWVLDCKMFFTVVEYLYFLAYDLFICFYLLSGQTLVEKSYFLLSDFVFLCLCLLTHIWSVLFPIIS